MNRDTIKNKYIIPRITLIYNFFHQIILLHQRLQHRFKNHLFQIFVDKHSLYVPLKIHKEKLKNWMQNFIKIINNHRFTKQDIPFVRDFLMPWSNRVMSIEKSLPGLNSTFLSYLLPVSFLSLASFFRFHGGTIAFYQGRINGIVCERRIQDESLLSLPPVAFLRATFSFVQCDSCTYSS